MIKFIRYELKRNLLPMVIFTAIACLIVGIMNTLSDTYYYYDFPNEVRVRSALLSTPTVIFVILCVIVPILQFSFRMKSRGADLWYSLPVKREKLMLVRTLAGLLLAVIPFTVSYWFGFFILLGRTNYYVLHGYLLYYLALLPLGVLLFGIYSFLFSRANTVCDGIIFMIAWTFIFMMPFLYMSMHNITYSSQINGWQEFTPFGMLYYVEQWFDDYICGSYGYAVHAPALRSLAWLIPIAAAEGIGAYAGLFLTARGQKAENSEQLSSSLWGYKVFIPLYVFMFGGCLDVTDLQLCLLWGAILLVGGYVSYIAYRHSFRLKLCDILSLLISFAAGIGFSLLGHYVF